MFGKCVCVCVFHFPFDGTRYSVNKLETKLLHGVYLGLRWETNEMYIGTATGVVRAAGIKRKTEPARCVWDLLIAVMGAPWKPTLQEHNVSEMKYQQPGVPWQRAVASSHYQCSQQCAAANAEFSAHAKGTSALVWRSRNLGSQRSVQRES